MKITELIATTFLTISVTGCATHAIEPLRMTYTYPVGERCNYPAEVACGAVAFWNDKTIELYMPYLQKSFNKKPQRFEFSAVDSGNTSWRGRMANIKNNEQDIEARFILKDDDDIAKHEAGNLYAPSRGMFVVTFPSNQEKYNELAGKTIWLVPSVGWDNVKLVRMLWASDAKLPESIGIRFAKD